MQALGEVSDPVDMAGLDERRAPRCHLGLVDPVIIEGHSDNIPPSGAGRYKTNKALSQARAANVRDVLSPYLSNPARISAIGVGSNKPLDNANTPAARSKNRRVDILLRKQQLL